MKILHISHHQGCVDDISYVADRLGLDITPMIVEWNYNVGVNRARDIWLEHKDYFEGFDMVLTSDTVPLSRILFQNGYKGRLVVWVCNRFDYADMASNDCGFPDAQYYEMVREMTKDQSVSIFPYTDFERAYASSKGIEFLGPTIRPCGIGGKAGRKDISEHISRDGVFFVPPYHNDTIFMNLAAKCDELGVPNYSGRYNGSNDLVGFKGLIHIPYAWSNLALFENMRLGLPYLIPTSRFLLELSGKGNFFWSPPFIREELELSEWYNPQHEDLFVFFDSWSDLKDKANSDLSNVRKNITEFAESNEQRSLDLWRDVFRVGHPVQTSKRKAVIWGHKLHSHTHSYIHYGYWKAFKALGWDVLWLDDGDDISSLDLSGSLFFTEGNVDSGIPIRSDCWYILHNCEDPKYGTVPPERQVSIQVQCPGGSFQQWEKIADEAYYNSESRVLHQHWATDLLPDEVEAMKETVGNDVVRRCAFVGSFNWGFPPFDMDKQTGPFVDECEKNGVPFIVRGANCQTQTDLPYNRIDNDEGKDFVVSSLLAPALQGHYQCDVGYIPCRIFKNISYGKVGVTNNPAVKELFGDMVVFNEDTRQLFHDAMAATERTTKEQILEAMDFVKEHHTYIDRVINILTIFGR